MTNDLAIGAPPPPRFFMVPHSPGADYVWVNGYSYPLDGRYVWHDGYWTRPPYAGAEWVSPRYDGKRFHQGYWNGQRGRVEHNHSSDDNRDRDLRVRHRLDWVTGYRKLDLVKIPSSSKTSSAPRKAPARETGTPRKGRPVRPTVGAVSDAGGAKTVS